MTNTLTAAVAGVLLATTTPTPHSNLQAIEALAARQQRYERQGQVHHRLRVDAHRGPDGTGGHAVAADDTVAGNVVPDVATVLNQRPDTTLQMTPQDIAYERARPWYLIRKPWRGAVRVRGGWLIHGSSDYTGFYRSVTETEARQLRHNR